MINNHLKYTIIITGFQGNTHKLGQIIDL